MMVEDYGLSSILEKPIRMVFLALPRKLPRKLPKKQEEILVYLKKNPNASRKELTETITDLTEDGVKYNLTRLKNLGLIQRVGPDKGGYWRVIE